MTATKGKRMKMASDYNILSEKLSAFLNRVGIDALIEVQESIQSNGRIVNKEKGYRWWVLHNSGFRIGDGKGMIGEINGDYNDDHIDSALRKFFKHKK